MAKRLMFALCFVALGFVLAIASFASAWPRGGGYSCAAVDVWMTNDQTQPHSWSGTVTVNGEVVVSQSGTAQPGETKVVSSGLPEEFIGTVSASIAMGGDGHNVGGYLDCRQATNTPTGHPRPDSDSGPTDRNADSDPNRDGDTAARGADIQRLLANW